MYLREELLPWDSQPQEAMEIDWSNPLARGLVAVACPALTGETVLSGTLAKVARIRGVSYFGTMRFSVGATYSLSSPHTVFTLFRPEGTVSALSVHTGHSTAGQSFWMGQGNSGEIFVTGGSNANAGTYSLGRDYAIAGVYSGATIYAYVDGVQTATAANSTSGTGKLVLMSLGAGGFPSLGSVALSMAFDRALTASEIYSLSQNPWQLFAPRTIQIPVSAGAGAPILSFPTLTSLGMTTARPRVSIAFP